MRLPALAAVAVCVLLGGCAEQAYFQGDEVEFETGGVKRVGTVRDVVCVFECVYQVELDWPRGVIATGIKGRRISFRKSQ